MPIAPACRLPPPWTHKGYRLRAECDADEAFLRALYASTRTDELAAAIGWSEARKAAFLAGQFAAQRLHFRTRIAGCGFWVIERGGDPVGRLYLQDTADRILLVDVALLPAERGNGLGSALLAAVLAGADAAAKPVCLAVEPASAAIRLYRRLGFEVIGAEGGRYRMARPVRAAAQALS
ncbi:GNAT family N-acetyltransferase [Sphingomonas sp. S1-29]|uniref:GNAT family N-acetyltransferase n=1 Tax=Sphingomonas sp. S1-29 TaxID=2991074 RepID=UPI00224042F4|nr:GNAT family N-acetyltransferase [Sphingomonas sp. S1-29]UZK69004.1 GNAT family N-acetyltransferase [Sphingomonas sp. S1-29]